MSSPHKNFRGQLDEELVLCYFRRHWIQILPALLLLPLCFAIFAAGVIFHKALLGQTELVNVLITVGLVLLIQVIHYLFLTIFRYYLSTVIITNMRVIILDKSVFFRDSNTTVDLTKIQDIKKVQTGFFHYLFKFGMIKLDLSGGDPIEINLVPQPDFYFKKMNEVKKALAPSNQSTPDPGSPLPVLTDVQERRPSSTVQFLETTPVK